MNSLCIFVHDTVPVSDKFVVKLLFQVSVAKDSITFTAKELEALRDALRISIGNRVDDFTEQNLSEFGMTMLKVTSVILKAKRLRLERRNY